MVSRVAAAGAGFLLAVLWFDLMFDVQVLRHRGGDVPEGAVVSIARYYRRVTTDARPMNRLVALAMVVTLVSIGVEVFGALGPVWVRAASVVLAVAPISLAARRTVPAAVRLGAGTDSAAQQLRLARRIGRDHVVCATSIAALVVVQVIVGPS